MPLRPFFASSSRFFLLAVAPLASVALACGGSTSAETNPTPGQFVLSFAHAVCDNLAGCCQKNGLAFDANACLISAEGVAQGDFVNLPLGLGATYDQAAADACISTTAASAKQCDDALLSGLIDQEPPYVTACSQVYVGTKAPGEPCATTYDCAPAPSGTTVSCAGWMSQNADGTTASGSRCQLRAPGTVGAVCFTLGGGAGPTTIADCPLGGLSCNTQTGKCQAPAAIGAACVQSTDCVAGANCSGGLCANAVAAGGPCVEGETVCTAGYYCNASSSTCLAQVGAGAACTGSEDGACTGFCGETEKCSTSSLAVPGYCGG